MGYSLPVYQRRSRSRSPQTKLIVTIVAVGSLVILYLFTPTPVSYGGKSSYGNVGKKGVSTTPTTNNYGQRGILEGLNFLKKVTTGSIPIVKIEPNPDILIPDDSTERVVGEDILPAKADLNINCLYDKLFSNISEGSHLIGSDHIKTEEETTWSGENKLKVFVVLHSHNDAGWGNTFERYFKDRTFQILNNILQYLSSDSSLKFIWCEISFFSRWWKELSTEKRAAVKKIVKSKQLEFVAGGWVMPDEANVHYISYLTQLIEGHQFLQQHLNVTARNGWAIDPFGLSTSINYLQSRAGINTSVFSRVHYSLRKLLRKDKSTEFLWRQQWDQNGSNDVLSYLMPYGAYDSGSTCGDRSACTFFLENGLIPTDQINSSATRILKALRKKAQIFNTNNLLYPIGGDFHWKTKVEWSIGVMNLKNVMEYINAHKELHTEIQFSTLDEYFTALRSEIKKGIFKPKSVIGDFFTYSDEYWDFWSGYYTSRIFHKTTERQLMSSLRTAQLLFTMMTSELSNIHEIRSLKFIQSLIPIIIQSRRELSIFQHHDGITGTSTDRVVNDYASRMHGAILGCQEVAINSMLTLGNLEEIKERFDDSDYMVLNSTKKRFQPTILTNGDIKSIGKTLVIQMEQSSSEKSCHKTVSVFNPLERAHKKLIQVGVSLPNVMVMYNGDVVESEIFPVFFLTPNATLTSERDTINVQTDSFELYFVVELKPLEIRHYRILPAPSTIQRPSRLKVKVFNVNFNNTPASNQVFKIISNSSDSTNSSSTHNLRLSNDHLCVSFNPQGMAESVELKQTDSERRHPFKISVKHYFSRRGLYSFFPEGEAKAIEPENPIIIVVEGVLQSYIEVWFQNVTLRHKVTLYRDGIDKFALDISNTINITKQRDYELVMNIATGIESGRTFYTDSNGFQMMRRKKRDIPIQGNFYPVASSAFIEDSHLRMTILAAQPGGGASLRSGELEIMQDRTNSYDDGHGIGQGGTDNLETVSKFKVMFEVPNQKVDPDAVPLLSLPAHHQIHNLLHPVPAFVETSAASPGASYNFTRYSPSIQNYFLPCDVGLVLSHPLPRYKDTDRPQDTTTFVHVGDKVGLIFNRVGYDKRFSIEPLRSTCSCGNMGTLNVHKLFGNMYESKLQRTGLSFVQEMEEIDATQDFLMKPMDMYGFTVKFKKIGVNEWDHAIRLNAASGSRRYRNSLISN